MAMYNGRRVLQVVRTVGGGTTVYVNGQPVATFDADTKLDKQTGATAYDQAYGKTTAGAQIMWNVDPNGGKNTLALRRADGRLKAGADPTEWNDVVIKHYADEYLNGKRYLHNILIVYEIDAQNDMYLYVQAHLVNNSSTAITSIGGGSGNYQFMALDYASFGSMAGSGFVCAVQKLPYGFRQDEFSEARDGVLFTYWNGSALVAARADSSQYTMTVTDTVTAF